MYQNGGKGALPKKTWTQGEDRQSLARLGCSVGETAKQSRAARTVGLLRHVALEKKELISPACLACKGRKGSWRGMRRTQ